MSDPEMTPIEAMARSIEQGFDRGEQLIDLMPDALQALADNITWQMETEARVVLFKKHGHILMEDMKAALIAAITAAKETPHE